MENQNQKRDSDNFKPLLLNLIAISIFLAIMFTVTVGWDESSVERYLIIVAIIFAGTFLGRTLIKKTDKIESKVFNAFINGLIIGVSLGFFLSIVCTNNESAKKRINPIEYGQ